MLADFVTTAGLTPYDVPGRRGELKHLLVTESPDGELMVRFVLRSQEPVARIRKHLPALRAELPALVVASVNLQPEHKAVLEGDREIVLTEQETLRMRVDGIDLHLRPQSFFQTNTAMAAELYRRGRAWVGEVGPTSVWDLYCGVGGFALTRRAPERAVRHRDQPRGGRQRGAEPRRGRAGRGAVRGGRRDGVRTGGIAERARPGDREPAAPRDRTRAERLARGVRGRARPLLELQRAVTLARDLAAMPSLRPVRAQLLDMFPNTGHYEVLTLLERS